MTPLRLAAPVLALALLAAPAAIAAETDGRLVVEGLVALPASTLEADRAALHWEADTLPRLVIDAQSAEVRRSGTRVTSQDAPAVGRITTGGEEIGDATTHGAARLVLDAGDGIQLLAMEARGPLTADLGPSELQGVANVLLGWPGPTPPATCAGTPLCLEQVGTYELRAQSAAATLAGEIVLVLRGPTLVVTEGGAETRYPSGTSETTTGAGTTTDDAWVYVTLQGASATVETGPDARWFVPEPTLEAASATLTDATGGLSVGSRSYRASDDVVEAAGALRLVPEPHAGAPRSDASAALGAPTYASSFSTRLAGDVQSINLRAVPVYEDRPAETAGAIAGAAALVGLAAFFWPALKFHGTALALPLYTRLQKPDILGNGVRNHIFEIIRASPGISARAIHRESDQSWGTVVYHLRQLERHHVVVSRSVGRTRNYYENHGKYRGMEVQLACLQADRARLLARAIVQRPGLTQEDLVAASAMPQPTTSYYVRKLKRAGLVEEVRDGRYVKYMPHADLERFLEMASRHEPAAVVQGGPAQA